MTDESTKSPVRKKRNIEGTTGLCVDGRTECDTCNNDGVQHSKRNVKVARCSRSESKSALWNRTKRTEQKKEYWDLFVILLCDWIDERKGTECNLSNDKTEFAEFVLNHDDLAEMREEFQFRYSSLFLTPTRKLANEVFDFIVKGNCCRNGLYYMPDAFPIFRMGEYSSFAALNKHIEARMKSQSGLPNEPNSI